MKHSLDDILKKDKLRQEAKQLQARQHVDFYSNSSAATISPVPSVERIDATAIIMRDIEALTALLSKNYSSYNETTIEKINESICELSDVLVKVSKTPSVLYQVGL